MNASIKAFASVALVIIFLSCFLLYKGLSHSDQELRFAIREQQRFMDGITNDIKEFSYYPYLTKIRYFSEQNEAVRQAMADGNRDLLLQLSLPHYQYLQAENPFFHAMDFNLPDGTVFLRVQKPELFGDNIGETRPIVSEVHRSRQQRAGFDVGKHGAIFWIAQPIVHRGEYLGLVEFGIEVKQLEKALADSLKSEVTSLLKTNQWQKAELVREGFQPHGDYVLLTHGSTLLDRITAGVDFSTMDDQQVTHEGKSYILHNCTQLPNFRGENIGRLILYQDITEQVLRRSEFIVQTLMLTGAALTLSFIVIYYTFGGLLSRLEEYATTTARAKKELQFAHDRLEERVRERTVELAKSNARLEDEVTIRQRAEVRLDEQRAFLETLIESMANPFYVIDVESYQVILANKAARSEFAFIPEHGLTCYRLTHQSSEPCSDEEHPCPLAEVRKTGRPIMVEHVHFTNTGERRHVEVHAYPIFAGDGMLTQMVEYTMDITDRKRAMEEKEKLHTQLIASQKMEAVGILAGGVAHDFNNILTTILGYSQILTLQLAEGDPVREMVNEIFDAADRAAILTRQLLAFSRRQVMEIKVVDPNTIITNIASMLRRLIGENIQLRLATSEQIGNIKADAGQIEQIIMNLAVNARDAMPSGGTLAIETGLITLDDKYSAMHPGVNPGQYVLITVTDTGIGMSREVQEQIFEPFFTTKKRGEGTGLGLSTVYGIVRQHNGHIYVYSEPGQGSTFKIYLPEIEGQAEMTTLRDQRSMPPGNETIMIVDDQAPIRRLLRDSLEPLGYELIEAGGGEDALALLSRSGARVQLVLSDFILPGMNGLELLKTLKDTRPEIKFILMSGYTNRINPQHEKLNDADAFIAKPLQPIALANVIRETLDAQQ